ncbi:MAG: flavodoxin-dependent (E)-4-hydroxy-3-methylbut-2-enyl-diphosphate synthase [Clostridiales bacterium]|jgi:(E)-4-hydroxy-3-methylbut-2-enyl-diphosphate synthase|nr:flavodoxin-dependent (E)-4-hydroxy-3-methylbut-2-enyl-diphosphate synthase [Clostridiales bacterium]
MPHRDTTKIVYAGKVKIGGGGVSVQSMCNVRTDDAGAAVAQIAALQDAGCDLVRLAVPDMAAARAFGEIRAKTDMPLVADIHFDYRLALESVAAGADKIRINPGNLGGKERAREVAHACAARRIPVRIGVNMGSVAKEIEQQYGRTPQAMVQSALAYIRLFNEFGFDDLVLSLKASDAVKTVEAYRLMSAVSRYPLHVGVTEAGTAYAGLIKSAVGIGALLLDGIGDTIRVSLTADPLEEVRAAKGILRAAGLLNAGIELISCPSCGRCRIDQIAVANKVEHALRGVDKNLKVAVMGCAVNGPGEARDADIGVAGGDGCAVLFKKGEIVRKIDESEIVTTLLKEIGEF